MYPRKTAIIEMDFAAYPAIRMPRPNSNQSSATVPAYVRRLGSAIHRHGYL